MPCEVSAVVDDSPELAAMLLKPVDGFGGLAEEVLVQFGGRNVVMVLNAALHGLLNRSVFAGLLLPVRSDAEHSLGCDEGSAEFAGLLDEHSVQAELGCLDGGGHARPASSDDYDVGFYGFGGLAHFVQSPDACGHVGFRGNCSRRLGLGCCAAARAGRSAPCKGCSAGARDGRDSYSLEKVSTRNVKRVLHDAPSLMASHVDDESLFRRSCLTNSFVVLL